MVWGRRELVPTSNFALNTCVIFKFPSHKLRRVILSPWACVREKSDKAWSTSPAPWCSAHGLVLGRKLSFLVLSEAPLGSHWSPWMPGWSGMGVMQSPTQPLFPLSLQKAGTYREAEGQISWGGCHQVPHHSVVMALLWKTDGDWFTF